MLRIRSITLTLVAGWLCACGAGSDEVSNAGSPTPTATATEQPTPSPTPDATPTPDPTSTPAPTPAPTPNPDPSATPTPSPPPSPSPTPTPVPGLTLLRTLPHSGWAEGLDVHDGELWHAFPSSHRVYDLMTGVEKRRYTPPTTYSESVTWFDGRLWNVSYHDQNLYAGTLNTAGTFNWVVVGTVPEIHSWGITHDGESIIVTGNGTENLYFLDPADGALRRTITTPIDDLEDIAWDRGTIWASSYSELPGQFFRIDPETGALLDVFSLPYPAECEIVDGLAVADGQLYVTGKNCPKVWVFALP